MSRQTYYGFSVLLSGLAKMWRGSGPALLAIVVNALVQSLLIWWNVDPGPSPSFLLSLVISTIAILVAYAILCSTALRSATSDSRVSWAQAWAPVRDNVGVFSLWVVAQWAVMLIGSMITPWLSALVALVTPFLALSAIDGRRNAFAVNLRALADRWGRWLVTALIVTVFGSLGFLLNAVNVFFVKGTLATFVIWALGGVIAWWLLTSWSTIYRSTAVGALPAEESSTAV